LHAAVKQEYGHFHTTCLHYNVHKSPPLVHILPITNYVCVIHFGFTLQRTPVFTQQVLKTKPIHVSKLSNGTTGNSIKLGRNIWADNRTNKPTTDTS
jgi:hypothetical protein